MIFSWFSNIRTKRQTPLLFVRNITTTQLNSSSKQVKPPQILYTYNFKVQSQRTVLCPQGMHVYIMYIIHG
jgi:c-di-GMP-binding flagellar brake protein YcgR